MEILQELGDIPPQSKRNLAKNLFSGFYERGISANAALKELQAAGLGYRRTDFLSDYAQGKGTYASETRIRFTRENTVPSERILEPKYFGTPDRYSMVFKASREDEEGNTYSSYFFYHRNSLDTRANMEDEALDWAVNSASDSGGENILSVRIVEGYINPLWK